MALSASRCACTPFRLLWKPESYSAGSLPTPGSTQALVKRISSLMRRWDGIQFARFPSDADEGQRCEETVRELVLRASRPAASRPEVA